MGVVFTDSVTKYVTLGRIGTAFSPLQIQPNRPFAAICYGGVLDSPVCARDKITIKTEDTKGEPTPKR